MCIDQRGSRSEKNSGLVFIKREANLYPLMKLHLGILLLLAACHHSIHSQLDFDQLCDLTNPATREILLEVVMDKLLQKYHIKDGLLSFGTCDPKDPDLDPDCANYNNPSVAYGSTLDPCPDDTCPPETPPAFLPGISTMYQPRQDHALVLFGCLPPETDYFGIRTYQYERSATNVQVDSEFCKGSISSPTGEEVKVFPPSPTVPGARVVVDVPWYDTRNQLSLNAVGKPNSPNKFRSIFVHVTTANKEVSDDIVRAFVESGVPVEAMNIDSIPDLPVFDLEGNSSIRDSFRTISRLVLPESFLATGPKDNPSVDDIDKYILLENMNILVRYLSPKSPMHKHAFLPRRPTTKPVGQNETDLVGKDTFQRLLEAVKSHYGEPDYVANPIPLIINMTKCLQGCYGGAVNFDTVFINADKIISLDGADFAVVCGANHVLLEYAVYTSVGIYNTSGLAVGLIPDKKKLNSASRFAPHLPGVQNFYCVELRSDCHDEPFCGQPIFSDIKSVLVEHRINLNPKTKTGPALDELIWPMILGYRGKSM